MGVMIETRVFGLAYQSLSESSQEEALKSASMAAFCHLNRAGNVTIIEANLIQFSSILSQKI
jgi:hypothetical protein